MLGALTAEAAKPHFELLRPAKEAPPSCAALRGAIAPFAAGWDRQETDIVVTTRAARFLCDSKVMEVIEGSTQIQQITIAKYQFKES